MLTNYQVYQFASVVKATQFTILGICLVFTASNFASAIRHPPRAPFHFSRISLLIWIQVLSAASAIGWLIEKDYEYQRLMGTQYFRFDQPLQLVPQDIWCVIASTFTSVMLSLVIAVVARRPNQTPEPTTMAVTPPAAQEPRQP